MEKQCPACNMLLQWYNLPHAAHAAVSSSPQGCPRIQKFDSGGLVAELIAPAINIATTPLIPNLWI